MPLRRRRRRAPVRRFRKRTMRRRLPSRRRRYMVRTRGMSTSIKGRSPLGNTFKATLRYVSDEHALDPGPGGSPGHYFYSANDAYDPDESGTGHQPLGFDEIMLMYNHFVVIGSKITVRFRSSQGDSKPQHVGIILASSSATPMFGGRTLKEYGNGVSTTIGSSSLDRSFTSLTQKCSVKKFLGRSKPLADPDLKGTAGDSPIEQAFYDIWCAPWDASDDTSGCVFYVELMLICVFIEPKQFAPS